MSAVMNGPLQRGGAGNRALNYAIIASVAFHGALLFLLSLERQAKREAVAPGPIVARLVSPAPAPVQPPAPAPAQPEPPKPRAEPAKPVAPVVKPVPLPKQTPLPRKEASVQPPAPSAAPPQPAAPPAEAAPAAPPAPVTPSPPAAAGRVDPQPGAPAPSTADGTLEIYRMELMRMARNYKRYPRVALDNNWEGKVVVRMVIGANGMIASLSVRSSAGHEILDKQALDMLQKAKPRVQIPPALRGREFSIEIPVIYNLKDQDSG
jgi:protein TonB